jgi:hypothetical protein
MGDVATTNEAMVVVMPTTMLMNIAAAAILRLRVSISAHSHGSCGSRGIARANEKKCGQEWRGSRQTRVVTSHAGFTIHSFSQDSHFCESLPNDALAAVGLRQSHGVHKHVVQADGAINNGVEVGFKGEGVANRK